MAGFFIYGAFLCFAIFSSRTENTAKKLTPFDFGKIEHSYNNSQQQHTTQVSY